MRRFLIILCIAAAPLAFPACTVDDIPIRHVEEQTGNNPENPDNPGKQDEPERPEVPPVNFTSFSLSGQGLKQVKSIINDTCVVVIMPEGGILKNLTATFDAGGAAVYIDGQLQLSGQGKTNFSTPVRYKICPGDGKEAYVTVSAMFRNDLPTIYVSHTYSVLPEDTENWIENYSIATATPEGKVTEMGKTSMKGRGNSTWWYPKKPYNIKLEKRQSMMGMLEHKRWCLMANWMDRTSLRNDIAFEIARRTKGFAWTPSGQFANLVLNGKDKGLYYICEQVRIDENRVNITEMEHGDLDGEKITGGYLLEFDTNYDEQFKFYTSIFSLPVMIKQPDADVMTYSKLLWVKNYLNDLENQLKYNVRSGEYRNLMDADSFIDFWFVQELTTNGEPNHPKSCFMYKDRGGKLFAGPVWDFDWNTFRYNNSSLIDRWVLWYGSLFEDPWFVARLKEKWNAEKADLKSIPDYIEEMGARIKTSAESNCRMWPINQDVNGDENLSYEQAVQRLKDNYTARFNYLDRAIAAM